MKVSRSTNNPIIEPKDVKPSGEDFKVIGVFNAGAARLEDEVVALPDHAQADVEVVRHRRRDRLEGVRRIVRRRLRTAQRVELLRNLCGDLEGVLGLSDVAGDR